jgi:molybdopterin synthase sulfur carrier subunit
MLKVLFFGRIADIAGRGSLDCGDSFTTVADLAASLAASDDRLCEALALPGVRSIVDQRFADMDSPLGRAREVAFVSPLSGG